MIFDKLSIKNFKRFHDLTLEFSPGINIIKGDNEKGKSTLLYAIEAILYFNTSTKSSKMLGSIKTWNGLEKPTLILDFKHDSNIYHLRKDFEKNLSALTQSGNSQKITSPEVIERQLSKFSGINNLDIFTSTALVKHSQVGAIEEGKELVEAMQKVLIGGHGNQISITTLMNKIHQKVNSFTLGLDRPSKNTGIIKALKDQLQSLENKLDLTKEQFNQVIENKRKQKDTSGKLDEMRKNILMLETLIENKKLYDTNTTKIEKLSKDIIEIEHRLNTISAEYNKLNEIEEKLTKFRVFEEVDIDSYLKQIILLRADIKSIEKSIKQSINTSDKEEKVNQIDYQKYGIISIAALSAIALILGIFSRDLFIVSISLLLILILGGVYVLNKRKLSKSFIVKINKRQDENELKKNDLNDLSNKLSQILTKFDCSDEEDFYNKKQKFSILLNQKKEIKSKLKGILGNRTEQDYKDLQIRLLTEKKEIEVNSLTEDVKNANITAEEFFRKKMELDDLKQELKKMEKENLTASVQLENSNVSYENVVTLEEQLSATKEEYDRATRSLNTYQWLEKGIQESIKRVSSKLGESLESEAKKFLTILTNNKYSKIKFQEDMTVQVYSNEKNDWIKPEESLSSGTIDQIYFIVRLAILNLISPNFGIPLFLDDTFITFDKLRRNTVFEILSEVSASRQILLFTCHDYFDKWGNLIEI